MLEMGLDNYPVHTKTDKNWFETLDYKIENVCRWFEKRFGVIAAEVGNHGQEFEGVEAGYIVKHESPVRIPI